MTEITQADRDATWPIWKWLWDQNEGTDKLQFMDGDADDHFIVQAFARHRMKERAAIVAWLREQDGHGYDTVRADCIEAGEHLK